MPTRYYLTLPEPEKARGADPDLAFTSVSADGFADELQAALRSDDLFRRWAGKQPDPDAVPAGLGAVDANATVSGRQRHLKMDLEVVTALPGDILRHRLRLLAGSNWTLNDVKSV